MALGTLRRHHKKTRGAASQPAPERTLQEQLAAVTRERDEALARVSKLEEQLAAVTAKRSHTRKQPPTAQPPST